MEEEGGDTDVDEELQNAAGGDTDVDEEEEEDEEDDRPPCWYGANCYRKNPQHFKEFKHPGVDDKPKKEKKVKKAATTKKAAATKKAAPPAPSSAVAPAPAAPAPTPTPSAPTPSSVASSPTTTSTSSTRGGDSSGKEAYRCVVQVILAKNKITPDEKRILRGFRRTHNVPDKDHFDILQEFGWTEDEYDDGERKDDDIEVDEERALLESSGGFGYIKLSKSRKMTAQQEGVFSKVAAQFYQTMAKAQGNYSIKEVWIVVNRDLQEKYRAKKSELTAAGSDVNEVLAFHGTSRPSIEGIAKTGFLPPTKLPSEKDSNSGGGGKKPAKAAASYKVVKNKKKKITTTTSKSKNKKKVVVSEEEEELDITVLDDGFFGKGIYFSIYSDYAMWYSEERQSDQILLCKVMKGKSYRCDGRMDGAGRKPGYDSHCSPKGNEIIIFEPDQVMPRYVISFESKEAEEREQEG